MVRDICARSGFARSGLVGGRLIGSGLIGGQLVEVDEEDGVPPAVAGGQEGLQRVGYLELSNHCP